MLFRSFPPRRTRRSYPKWVGVGFHLFRGAASSGRETIHNPPSVKGERKRLIDDIVNLAANKLEYPGQPQGPIFEQELRLVWYELEIDGSTNQDELQRWLVSLRKNPRQCGMLLKVRKTTRRGG